MCGVVVIATRWWLAWLLVSVACLMALLGANLSPSWLLAPPYDDHSAEADLLKGSSSPGQSVLCSDGTRVTGATGCQPVDERPSIGLWIRCVFMKAYLKPALHCGVYATRVSDLPPAQVASLVAVVAATAITTLTCFAIFSATCVRVIRGRSWFSTIGTIQAVAGVLSLLGAAIFPLGWDSFRVRSMCGDDAGFYYPSACTVGWAMYAVLGGSLGLLLCTCLATFSAKSTATDRVSNEIAKGNQVVCLI